MIGCDSGLEEININPNESVTNPSLDLMFGSILPGFISQPLGSFGQPGQFAQQFANLNSEEGSLTHDDDSQSRKFWEIVYSENNGALRNASFLIFEAENQENLVYQALGKIYKVYMLSYTTDLFGDVPYTEAGKGFFPDNEFAFPKYDAQQEIYRSMINDLESANTLLAQASGTQTIDATRDLLFGGDNISWRKFANTLRLRLLMRMSGAESVGSEVQAILSDALTYPVISSINDEPTFSRHELNDWPFNPEVSNISEIRLSATVVDIMKGEGGVNNISDEQDPRLAFLIDPTENSIANGTPEFVGQPVGLISDTEVSANRSLLSNDFRNLNKLWMITYAELLYIKSEAAHRGYISGSAASFLEEGIIASIERYGINSSSAESIAYLASISANFTGNEIKHIAIQRWLDQVNNGFEGYSVWRRLDFPVLSLGQMLWQIKF